MKIVNADEKERERITSSPGFKHLWCATVGICNTRESNRRMSFGKFEDVDIRGICPHNLKR
jgi:hypothetical protein